jgi:thioredoxin
MDAECAALISDEEFEAEVLQHPGTVLVDFYTPHCQPCKQIAPVVERLCTERRSDLKVLKMDAAENPTTAARHGVSVVPTFLLFHHGKKVGQIAGAHSQAKLEKWIATSVG